jgi:hypothetical protein
VDSWWRWFVHCSYCFCLCDEPTSTSHRYFSLRPVESDLDQNRIVTGVKLEKVNGMIHLRIHQAKATRGGETDVTTAGWQKVNHMRVEEGLANEDFMALSWEERALDLDDVFAPKSHVVTGVKFRKLGGHIGLAIKVNLRSKKNILYHQVLS